MIGGNLKRDLSVILSGSLGRRVVAANQPGAVDGLVVLNGLAPLREQVDPDTLFEAIATGAGQRRFMYGGLADRRSAAIGEALSRGGTVVADRVEAAVSKRTYVFHALARYFEGPLTVNAYATPPQARGLGWHADNHWAFVYQYEGSKKWSLGRRIVEDPSRSQEIAEEVACDDGVVEIELSAGDGLLVPPGLAHVADAGPEGSIHLTQGLPPPWFDRGPLIQSGNSVLICAMPPLPAVIGGPEVAVDDRLACPYGAWVDLSPGPNGAELAVPGLGVSQHRAPVVRLHPDVASIVDRIVARDGSAFGEFTFSPGHLADRFGFDLALTQQVCSKLRSLGVVYRTSAPHTSQQPRDQD